MSRRPRSPILEQSAATHSSGATRLTRLWRLVQRGFLPLLVTAAVVMAFAALLATIDASGGGLTVRLFPSGLPGQSSSNSASSPGGSNSTPAHPAAPLDATQTAVSSPTPAPTNTPAPPPATATPLPVAATITCAHAQSAGPTGNPDTYIGELCVHTAPNSPITVAIAVCGGPATQAISGMSTDASGNWSLTSTSNRFDPWSFTASCALPFAVALTVSGTAPGGDTISGSGSFTVTQ